MYYVYILRSLINGRYYVGSTSDLESRVRRHNAGGSTWTKKSRPWEVVYSERQTTKSEAVKREREIKGYKGGLKFKGLLLRWGGGAVNRACL